MRSIRTKFTALTALAIIISILAVGTVSAQYLRNVANGYLENLLALKCSNMGKEIESHFAPIEQCVDTVDYHAKNHMSAASPDEMKDCLDDINTVFRAEVAGMEGVLSYYFVLDPLIFPEERGLMYMRNDEGDFTATPPDEINADIGDDEIPAAWFYMPRAKGRPMWIDPYSNEKRGGIRMISYVKPVFVDSKFIGVAGIDYDYEKLKEYTRYDGHFEDVIPFLVDENEKIIVHPEFESGTPLAEISGNLSGSKLPSEQSVLRMNYGGITYKVSWTGLSSGMRFYLAAPERAVKEHWMVILRRFILITLIMLAVFAALSIMISGQIAKPLTRLAEAAERINKGDYDVDLEYSGDDEVGMLTNSFRQLTDHLKAYISDLNDMAYKDALTSVRNMGAFEIYKRMLDDGIKGAGRGKRPEFAICMFDCNNLKEINDSYGHDKGDIFLKNACALICNVFTHSPVFRIGGDEFICILQNEDFKNRKELRKRFYERMEAANAVAYDPWDRIDIAGGMAIYAPGIDSSVQDVLNRADNMMYKNKNRSKEQVDEEIDK